MMVVMMAEGMAVLSVAKKADSTADLKAE